MRLRGRRVYVGLSPYLDDDFSGKHRNSETLDNWYCLLCKLGYSMSTEEQQLLDGTHECFNEEAEDENTATE